MAEIQNRGRPRTKKRCNHDKDSYMPVPQGFTKADFQGKNADPIRDLRIKDFISYFLATNVPDHEAIFIIKKQFDVEITKQKFRSLKAEVMSNVEAQAWLNSYAKIGFVSDHIKDVERVKMMSDKLVSSYISEMQKDEEERDYQKISLIVKDLIALTKLALVLRAGTPILARIKAMIDAANINATKSGPKTHDVITVPNVTTDNPSDVVVVSRDNPNKNIEKEEMGKAVQIDKHGRIKEEESSQKSEEQHVENISSGNPNGGNSEFIQFLMEESKSDDLIPKRLKSGLNLTTIR